jgi:PiT family inorganic phosphate transporter
MWWIANALGGGLLGAGVITAILIAFAGVVFARSRKNPVHADNVNDEWQAPQQRSRTSATV